MSEHIDKHNAEFRSNPQLYLPPFDLLTPSEARWPLLLTQLQPNDSRFMGHMFYLMCFDGVDGLANRATIMRQIGWEMPGRSVQVDFSKAEEILKNRRAEEAIEDFTAGYGL